MFTIQDQTTIEPSALDNILMNQKDNILAIVNTMQHSDKAGDIRTTCERIIDRLNTVSELWLSVRQSYGYKLVEICEKCIVFLTEAWYQCEPMHARRSEILQGLRMRFIKLSDSYRTTNNSNWYSVEV